MNFKALVAIALGAFLIVAQFIPVRLANPPAAGELVSPPNIKTILRENCYDCHSDQTRWPWYRHVAPISWLIVRDVQRGRKELNFSGWADYYPATRRRKLQWIGRAVREKAMPPLLYRVTHPKTGLDAHDRMVLELWIESQLSNPPG